MRVLLIVYDNNSYIAHFPISAAYVAASLIELGNEVTIYNQDVYHYPEKHLTEYLDCYQYDVIGVGMCGGYYQYQKLLKIVDAVHESSFVGKLWLGGHLVSPEPEYFQRITGADYICSGDFCDVVNTQPALDLFPIDYYSLARYPHATATDRCFPVLSGHGCPFKCTFCYRLTVGYKERPILSILDEITFLKANHVTYIDFADELLMVSRDRIQQLCRMMKTTGLKWSCNGRLNYARLDILKTMHESGCVFINYGIESLDDRVLYGMNKNLTVRQIYDGVQNTIDAGISPGLNVMFGNVGDTAETLQRTVDFLLRYDDHSQLRTIRPVTPYPGCDLYYYAIEYGLLRDVADFYENRHMNSDLLSVNFTDLSDDEFHRLLFEANKTLLESYYQYQLERVVKASKKLYLERDTSFRGYRQT